jgi:hypothetical protein
MRLPRLTLLLALFAATSCSRDDVSASARPSLVDETPAAASATSEPDLPSSSPPPLPAPPGDDPKIPMPGPGRRRLGAAVARNATCESCHVEEAREWRGSYHRRAGVEPAYLRAFAIEPSPFCRSCHVPEADPSKEPPGAVRELGVGCVTCHVTEEGFVLAAAHPDDEARPTRRPSPHPVRRSKAFADVGGCAGCHEFRFPGPGGGSDDARFMQTTAREHLRSPAAAKPCAECHMPARRGRRSHTFEEVRDDAWLRANLDVTAERTPDDVLRITLSQPAPGHDFPTGDLFRRLEIGYEIADARGTILRREARALARHFEVVPHEIGRQLARDDRVHGDEPAVVELELPSPAEVPLATRLSWWVTYQRVATVGTGKNPADARIESEVPLHSGSLSWNSKPPSVTSP